ncbi:hypothetical protein J8J14_05800 [Roseomonas sp. SSH11]|uniref:Uncharacterized protein n=1 Tax=Pararoseomonas baculiformis TaxID=2820812 RepID=A0ABS4ABA7_9PROT|nr:hypothetical protein [Pararoseomonas baculiformis]MBP0444288.1 hypothetical protein [Pararoseomonas baculiformis]
MPRRLSDRIDDLLDMALALKRDLAESGHRVEGMSPNFVQHILSHPDALGAQPLSQPYEAIAPGLTIGFRKGAKPDLHLRPTPDGALEVTLQQRTSSGWVTLEMDWDHATLREKRRATLLLRGSSPDQLVLSTLLRRTGADGASIDIPGRGIELGPDASFHAIEFNDPGDEPETPQTCRVIVFCPVHPFAMRLTELSLR